MSKEEAIQALNEGHAVTHRYFSDYEFIRRNGDRLEDENGHLFTDEEFWEYRQIAPFDIDWSIKNFNQNTNYSNEV